MTNKAKDFDCVKMKNDAQKKIQEEDEQRKQEFKSFAEFLHAKAKESPWQREILEKARSRQKASA